MAKLILEFTFAEEWEDDGCGSSFKNLELQTITRKLAEGMTEADVHRLAEAWGQSDYYHVGVHNALLTAIGEGEATAEDVTSY